MNMDFMILQDDYFSIEHCYSCSVPGYLIVSARCNAESVDELPSNFQARLGYSLAMANRLIRDCIQPLRIYTAQFGEENRQLHFHIFPRTAELTDEFLKHFPEQRELIHGPVLLDWARTKYYAEREQVWPQVSMTVAAMRALCRTTGP